MEGYFIDNFVSTQFFLTELRGVSHLTITALTGIHSDHRSGQARNRTIFLHEDPEIFAAGIGRLQVRITLGKTLAINESFVIKHGKVTHRDGSTLDGLELGQITPKTFEKLIHLGILHHRLFHGHLKPLVFWQGNLRTGHNCRGETQGTITFQFDLGHIWSLNRLELLLGDRIAHSGIQELAGHFLLDVLPVFFLNNGERSFSLAETWEIDMTAVFRTDFLPLRLKTLRRKLDVEIDDAGLFLFDGDFHDEPSSKAWSTKPDNPQR